MGDKGGGSEEPGGEAVFVEAVVEVGACKGYVSRGLDGGKEVLGVDGLMVLGLGICN